MEILGKLLGTPARVKIMRLFLLNGGQGFENADIIKRAKVSKNLGRKEISLLASTGFIKPKSFLGHCYAKASQCRQDQKDKG